jgi:phosphohistidine phosphatase
MTRTLWLIRHASAAAGAADHARPLSEQGAAEAAEIARKIAAHPLKPAVFLASGSARTLATARPAAALLAAGIETVPGLYLAGPERILEEIAAIDDAVTAAAIVGHNPGIGQLALDLGGAAHPLIARGFPPATAACFEVTAEGWAGIGPAHCRLVAAFGPFDA